MNEFENYLIIGLSLPFLITIISFPFYLFPIRNNIAKNNKSIFVKFSDHLYILSDISDRFNYE